MPLLHHLALQHALEKFHGVLLLFYGQGRSTLERIFNAQRFVLVFAHDVIGEDIHALYDAVLATARYIAQYSVVERVDVAEDIEFAESKKDGDSAPAESKDNDFMDIPENQKDDMPF